VWLLLHGVPLSAEVWDETRLQLPGRVLAPDLNTTMASAPPDGVLQRHVAAAVVADTPADDLTVVGHSFGGQVALEVALLAPRRVRRLVLVCTRHTPFPAFARGAQAVSAGAPVDIDAGMRRWFTPAEVVADGPAVRYARRRVGSAPRRSWAAALAAVATYDRSAALGGIGMPVALLAAGHDEVSPPDVMSELAAALPDGVLEVVDDWAHMSAFAHPVAFAGRLAASVRG
jgi:pimeloyl-ACP methyl ester carboxylesterase